MQIYLCPCCERPAVARKEPITEDECERSLAIMSLKGWTAESLLAKRRDDLDFMAPGFTLWLKRRCAAG